MRYLSTTTRRYTVLLLIVLCTFTFLKKFQFSTTGTVRRLPNKNEINITRRSIDQLIDEIKGGRLSRKPANSLLIYSRERSGSSFLGNIFSHHPLIYYTLEPMKFFRSSTVYPNGTALGNKTLVSRAVHELFQCRFRDLILNSTMPAIWKNVAFCREMEKPEQCGKLKIVGWEKRCRKYQYSVSKAIMLESLASLEPLSGLGYNILQLVRDPRAMFNSRMQIAQSKQTAKERNDLVADLWRNTKNHCKQYSNDFQYLTTSNQSIQRYKLLRYEDISLDPEMYAKKLYSFVNWPYHQNVSRWIQESTTVSATNKLLELPYSTFRNSTKTAFAWWDQLDRSNCEKIEKYCGEVMDQLGYKRRNVIGNTTSMNKEMFMGHMVKSLRKYEL